MGLFMENIWKLQRDSLNHPTTLKRWNKHGPRARYGLKYTSEAFFSACFKNTLFKSENPPWLPPHQTLHEVQQSKSRNLFFFKDDFRVLTYSGDGELSSAHLYRCRFYGGLCVKSPCDVSYGMKRKQDEVADICLPVCACTDVPPGWEFTSPHNWDPADHKCACLCRCISFTQVELMGGSILIPLFISNKKTRLWWELTSQEMKPGDRQKALVIKTDLFMLLFRSQMFYSFPICLLWQLAWIEMQFQDAASFGFLTSFIMTQRELRTSLTRWLSQNVRKAEVIQLSQTYRS